MKPADSEALLALEVSDEQLAFVDPLSKTLSVTNDGVDNHVLEADGRVVGFFQIHRRYEDDPTRRVLAVEELSIDIAQQGKGYGKEMMGRMGAHLLSEYPGWPTVRLTVNFRNQRAYRLYRFGGFVDTGEVDHSGRSGPQHVMTLALA